MGWIIPAKFILFWPDIQKRSVGVCCICHVASVLCLLIDLSMFRDGKSISLF